MDGGLFPLQQQLYISRKTLNDFLRRRTVYLPFFTRRDPCFNVSSCGRRFYGVADSQDITPWRIKLFTSSFLTQSQGWTGVSVVGNTLLVWRLGTLIRDWRRSLYLKEFWILGRTQKYFPPDTPCLLVCFIIVYFYKMETNRLNST